MFSSMSRLILQAHKCSDWALQLSATSLGWVHTGEEAEDQELDEDQSQLHI